MNISLRPVQDADLPLIKAWRDNPNINKGFYQQGQRPLVWEEHVEWFNSRNSDWRTFLVLYGDDLHPVGLVNIGQLDHWSPEIGYLIGDVSLWGSGVATEAVKLGIQWLRGYAHTHRHITGIHTTIKDNNIGSIHVIEKCGFKQGMVARKGEHYWQRNLS